MGIGGIRSNVTDPRPLDFGLKSRMTEGGMVSGPEFRRLERRARSYTRMTVWDGETEC